MKFDRLGTNMEYSDIAKRWFRGVYGSDSTVVSELAAEDVMISYPIFQTLFGKPALRGKQAARKFADGFSQRWKEVEVTFHETIAQETQVVLVWSFKGRNADAADKNVHTWGGITLIRFDADGKIAAEIGEESDPGPIGRLSAGSY